MLLDVSTVAVALLGILGGCALHVQNEHALPITVITSLSILAYTITNRCLPDSFPYLIKAGLFGKDINKKGTPVVPESGGVVCGTVYLLTIFIFLPAPFLHALAATRVGLGDPADADKCADQIFKERMAGTELVELVVACLSICCMVLLGFADDVLDLKWRVKFTLPFFATLPLLMVYYISYNHTSVLLPSIVQDIFGLDTFLDLGALYYVFMIIIGIFCTNAINIYAGVNGLEVGQSIIIGVFVCLNSIIQLGRHGHHVYHLAFYIIMPFLAVSLALFRHNWYPAQIFVGDTYCYFAGMTLYVVGTLSHTSKTMMLFFIPQWINFLYSLPQLFKLLGVCPRHRMPRINLSTGKLEASKFSIQKQDIKPLGRVILFVLGKFRLVEMTEDTANEIITLNNFTLINFVLIKLGPMHEDKLCATLLVMQVMSGVFGLIVRYRFAGYVYAVVE